MSDGAEPVQTIEAAAGQASQVIDSNDDHNDMVEGLYLIISYLLWSF